MATSTHTVQKLLDAKTLIEQALPDETPEQRLQMLGLLLYGPAQSDRRAPAPEGNTKAEQLIQMLKRPQGTTLKEVMATFDIQRNSAYARISVVSRKHKLRVRHEGDRYMAA